VTVDESGITPHKLIDGFQHEGIVRATAPEHAVLNDPGPVTNFGNLPVGIACQTRSGRLSD
jgi:hypothetical protein